MAVTPDGNFLYVNELGNDVSVIDAHLKAVVKSITIGTVGDGPLGVAVALDRGLVYVTQPFSGNISVIDTSPNEVERSVPAWISAPASRTVRLTAIVTATSSTVLLLYIIRRTPHAHLARSDLGSACIC